MRTAPTNDPECPFCAIIGQNDLNIREIYRDDQTVAFFPKSPAVLGHTLVIPTIHVATVWDLDAETAHALTSAVHRLCLGVRDALHPDGLNIIQSNGEVATQTVPHIHVHVLPRWADDAMGDIWPVSPHLSEDEKDKAARQIRSATLRHYNIPQVDREDMRTHLNFVQAIIARMSVASSNTKSWLLPVITATYGYALTRDSWKIGFLGVAAVILFAFIDASYLRQERAYRKLYDRIVSRGEKMPSFSLDPSYASDEVPAKMRFVQKLKILIRQWFPPFRVWLSWSIAPFYGAFLLVGIVAIYASR